MKSWQERFQPHLEPIASWMRANSGTTRWILVGCAALFLIWMYGQSQTWGPNSVSLFDSRQLTRDEISLMQVAFGKSGLNEYQVKGSEIQVPLAERGNYLKSLSEHGAIPQDLTAQQPRESTFDMFRTRAQQRQDQLSEKKKTIREMVMQLRFVERAIVDYDEVSGNSPFEPKQRTALVNITPNQHRELEMSEIKAIRDTVRGAVAGLRTEDITIIDTFASRSHTGASWTEANLPQPHAATKLQAEREYETKIRSALTNYPGIRVNVEVGIDPIVRRVRDENSISGDPVFTEHTLMRETVPGTPSTAPSTFHSAFQVGANGQAITENESESENQTIESDARRVIQRTQQTMQTLANGISQTTESAGPVVTSVNVSIGIPERCVSYFVDRQKDGRDWTSERTKALQDQIFESLKADIRQKVAPLVPQMVASNQTDEPQSAKIVVTLDHEITLDRSTQLSLAKTESSHWLTRYWPWFVLFAMGLVAMSFLRPVKVQPPVEDSTSDRLFIHDHSTVDSDSVPVTEGVEIVETPTELISDPLTTSREALRLQLDQWCRENPDAAAATIRQWLDKKAG